MTSLLPQLSLAHSAVLVSFVGFFLETLLCGALIIVFGTGVWAFFSKTWTQGRSRRDLALYVASAVMFVLAIAVRLVRHLRSVLLNTVNSISVSTFAS